MAMPLLLVASVTCLRGAALRQVEGELQQRAQRRGANRPIPG